MRFPHLGQYRVGGTTAQMELAIPLPKTPDGRVYRYSPNENAHPRHFVIGGRDEGVVIGDPARKRMKITPGSERTVCPYSGTIGSQQEFTHPDDQKAALELVKHAALADVQGALGDMFEGLASKSSGTLRFERGRSSVSPRPQFSRSDLMRELVCDCCGQDYGVFAIGLFCPGCGAPNLRLHFGREVELVVTQVGLAERQAESTQELAYRLLGNAHEDVLTAFEATLKTVYLYGVMQRTGAGPTKPPKNDFQNVEFARRRYAELGLDPFEGLTGLELEALRLNIQMRHVIGHNLGVVDAKFAEHATDARVGETVALVGSDIRQFAEIAARVVARVDAWLTGEEVSPAPTVSLQLEISPLPPEPPRPSNDLDLSSLAFRIGMWAAERSRSGQCHPIDGEDVAPAFPENTVEELREAFGELEGYGYVHTSGGIGNWLIDFEPTLDLFAMFEPRAGRGDPTQDAVTLAEKVLKGDGIVTAEALHTQTGWPLRRFNIALSLLLGHVQLANVSDELTSTYPTRSFHVLPEERFHLRRFVERTKR